MNDLILTFFGDGYITLDCQSGECLHYSQVPGYVVCVMPIVIHTMLRSLQSPPKQDNTRFLALSAAGIGLIVLSVSAGMFHNGTLAIVIHVVQVFGMQVAPALATLAESACQKQRRLS